MSIQETGAAFSARLYSGKGNAAEEEDDTFELLPPGCSMMDPTYDIKDSEPTVLLYDDMPAQDLPELESKGQTSKKKTPQTPLSRGEAQAKIDAKNAAKDEEPYVYLPPGSSMKDPGYNSMSDPLEKRVYHRDPVPSTKQ